MIQDGRGVGAVEHDVKHEDRGPEHGGDRGGGGKEHAPGHEKTYEIIVNGVAAVVERKTVTFEQVVEIAFPAPPGPDTIFLVTYRKAQKPREGKLVPGQSVEVKHRGTVFNVTPTNRS